MYTTARSTSLSSCRCVHPLQGPDARPVALYGRHGGAALDGEVDTFAAPALAQILEHLPEADTVLDVGALSFIDGHGATALHKGLCVRRDGGRPIAVTDATPALRRIWELCGFDASLLDAA